MSKTVKRKITVELPKPRDLSKNRLSVFQRLGTKKLKLLDTSAANKVSNKCRKYNVFPFINHRNFDILLFVCGIDGNKTNY